MKKPHDQHGSTGKQTPVIALKTLLLSISLLLFNGCTTEPASEGQIGAWVGYQEQQLSESSYQLSYTDKADPADEKAAWSRVEGLWQQRAQELCGSDNYMSSKMVYDTPCRTHYAVYGAYLRREEQCLLELSGVVQCQ
ncbi:MAG: hypothetical protein V7707_09285 [Motiliproteus sp.]